MTDNNMLTVIVPSRNERFMPQTVDDLFRNAVEEIEVIVVLEGYWPDVLPEERPNLRYIHFGKPRGLRGAVNAAVAIARGKYIMKVDAHCAFGEGYDKILKEDLEPNWVAVPRRYSLDAENWCRKQKHPIDYLWCEVPSDKNNWEINVRVWGEKNYDEELKKKLIDDVFTFQGSCWIMHRDYFYELELMDDVNYGTFRKEPQEITFKAWLSGGRAIRNKKTWYAHLHKGRQYGRGYRPSRTDWKKGDQYLLNWLTNSAWDKQTIPFKWMIDKFDMPGWEDFDWSKYETDGNKFKPVRLYQNLDMAGVVPQNEKKNNSKFWNEGKWDNFVAPMLPDDVTDQTFVEMGCNAGLFLSLAESKGFTHVVGIEKDKTPVKMGLQYRDQIGYNYKLLKRTLGGKFHEDGTFDIDELPIADYTLMSTFHYYVDINAWIKYIDRLQYKTCNVIFVSRPKMKYRHWQAYCSLDAIRAYFPGWEEVKLIDNVDKTDDPHPRDLFSVTLKNPSIARVPIESIDIRYSGDQLIRDTKRDFAKNIAEHGSNFDPYTSSYYDAWKERKPRWSDRTLRYFINGKYSMMLDLRDNGQKDAILLDKNNRQVDGGHRLIMMQELGYNSVIVRKEKIF